MTDELVSIHGIEKHRWRCPICDRATSDNICVVHGEIKPYDILNATEKQIENSLFNSIYEFLTGTDKKVVTLQDIHDGTNIDIDYLHKILHNNPFEVDIMQLKYNIEIDGYGMSLEDARKTYEEIEV